jgi:AcrR family transcriptional regulator
VTSINDAPSVRALRKATGQQRAGGRGGSQAAGSRRRMPAHERRELILDAALQEFAAHGYDGASMGRIGQAAGVSRTVLYDHFSSKRELFSRLLSDRHADLLAHLRAALQADAPMEQRMRACADSFFAFAEREPAAWRLLFPERPPADHEVAHEYHRLRAESNRLLAELIAPDARRAGIDPRSGVGQAMFALHQAALHGIVHWWHAHPGVTRAELVEAMQTLWVGFGALKAR